MADVRNEINPLSGTEYNIIGAGVFNKLAEYEDPEINGFDYQGLDGDGRIGFMTIPGGKYLSRDVCGGYTAQLPFQIMYQAKATSNKELLKSEKTLTDVAVYLETKPFPELDGGRQITKISCDGIPYRAQADNSASVIFVQTGSVVYEK